MSIDRAPFFRSFHDRVRPLCRPAGHAADVPVCWPRSACSRFLAQDELFISGANLTISVLTLLLLPILQATQNRDGAALQAKIDELIKASSRRGMI